MALFPLTLKNGNTPGIRFNQDNSGGYSPYIWDIGANEANFFVRGITGGSQLVFRAFPGAEGDLLRLEDGGYAATYGQYAIGASGHTSIDSFNSSGVLTDLRDLTFQTYKSVGSDHLHLRPEPSTWSDRFGGAANRLSISDMATVALAGVKEVDARIDGLALPDQATLDELGAEHTSLRNGQNALKGENDALKSEVSALKAGHDALKSENAALKKQQKSMAKSLKKLQKQMRKLARRR